MIKYQIWNKYLNNNYFALRNLINSIIRIVYWIKFKNNFWKIFLFITSNLLSYLDPMIQPKISNNPPPLNLKKKKELNLS